MVTLVIILSLMITGVSGQSVSKVFHSAAVEDCNSTNSTAEKTTTTLSDCSVLCSSRNDCDRFMFCPDSDLCGLGGSPKDEGALSGCQCYVQITNCQNGGTLNQTGGCNCVKGYYGKNCAKVIRADGDRITDIDRGVNNVDQSAAIDCPDCTEGYAMGFDNGEHTFYIKPDSATEPFPVICDFGFTFIQQRRSRDCPKENFNRSWVDYRQGFGRIGCDYWLGLDKIHQLTSQGQYKLGILVDTGTENYTQCFYTSFSVGGAASDFLATMQTSHADPTCASLLTTGGGLDINGRRFITSDHDNSGAGCSANMASGWWFHSSCGNGNMNGPYFTKADFNASVVPKLNVGGYFDNKWIKDLVLRIERE